MPTDSPQGENKPTVEPVLATTDVNYMGEAVAVVSPRARYAAEDARRPGRGRLRPLPAVEDVLEALKPDSPKVHDYLPNNISSRTMHESPDIKKAFEQADEVISVAFLNQRIAAVTMEPRAVLASYDSGQPPAHRVPLHPGPARGEGRHRRPAGCPCRQGQTDRAGRRGRFRRQGRHLPRGCRRELRFDEAERGR